ncbi:hypothetical protein [Pantoea ananatis]|uniref:RipA family octameric membrane protein n=1 Tax=Pantoea ananas TaxID=553 RepID=UPI001B300816|nr:hypothetical protein [Pantoea ananatis]
MLNQRLINLKNNNSDKALDKEHKDKEAQRYFKEKTANEYIKKLLNSPEKEFLTNRDYAVLKESYDKAHDIRKFEIDLYWKRTTYVWTLIASLITVTGLLLTAYYRLPSDSDVKDTLIFMVEGVAVLGIIITIIGSKIIQGGEFWQKNWEYHVSLLEPLFSGRIYTTLVNKKSSRFSISKLNVALYLLILGVWLLLSEGMFLFTHPGIDVSNFFIILGIFSVAVFLISVLIDIFTYRKPSEYEISINHWSVKIK